MKIPCTCKAGWHSFTATEMVLIIEAFQRGEMQRTRYVKGEGTTLYPLCLANADFSARDDLFTGACGVELENGTRCGLPRGHHAGRHGLIAHSKRKALRSVA
jgi:hypothetical protein